MNNMENLQNFVSKSFTGERGPAAVIRREHLSFSVEDLLASPGSGGGGDGEEAFSSGDELEEEALSDREDSSDGAPLTGTESNRLLFYPNVFCRGLKWLSVFNVLETET